MVIRGGWHERQADAREARAAERRLERMSPRALVQALVVAANRGQVARAKALGRHLAERLAEARS